jgi:predicted transcriptional regulator of viral defense system
MARAMGISEANRELLEVLHRQAAGPFSVADATQIWKAGRARAGRLLAHLAARGWLTRVRRGFYVVVPLGATAPRDWREDPWLIAMKAFSPCYLGGWTACVHWELTEQLFRDVMVFSARPMARRRFEIQGTWFRVKVVAPERLFGLAPVWRGRTRVRVSDPSRTLVDVLADPTTGGGMRHVSEVVATYFATGVRDDAKLIDYASRLGNRTVFKRLGYLVERFGIDAADLVKRCQARMSAGVSLFDPELSRRGMIVSRWRLLVNVTVGEQRS